VSTLHMPLKGKWFNQIKSGEHKHIHLTLGYPKKEQEHLHLYMPYQGYTIKTIESEQWNFLPMECFAIDSRGPRIVHFEASCLASGTQCS